MAPALAPNAFWIAKADDDAWVNLPSVLAELRLTSPRWTMLGLGMFMSIGASKFRGTFDEVREPRDVYPFMQGGFRVYSADKPGLLANISAAFTRADVNITQAHCLTTEDMRAVNTFEVLVSDTDQLKHAMRLIEKIKGVYRVERT